MPRVSILLTCYNHIKYLPAALESIRRQTFTDYEIIALDDGSQDGTREWLSEHAQDAKLIFNKENLGTYGTLNEGLSHASGEFIAVFNDDDLWADTKLEAQVEMMDNFPKVGLVHTDGYFIDGEGAVRKDSPLGFDFPKTETGDVLLTLIYHNKIIASAALARRECFEKVGEFNASYFGSGDWEMWFRIAEQYHVGYVKDPLTMYRVHGANASHKLEKIWQDDQMLREWMLPRLETYAGRFNPEELTAAKAHNWACLGTVRTLNGDPEGGREAYKESLKLLPGRFKSRLRMLATHLPKSAFRKLL